MALKPADSRTLLSLRKVIGRNGLGAVERILGRRSFLRRGRGILRRGSGSFVRRQRRIIVFRFLGMASTPYVLLPKSILRGQQLKNDMTIHARVVVRVPGPPSLVVIHRSCGHPCSVECGGVPPMMVAFRHRPQRSTSYT